MEFKTAQQIREERESAGKNAAAEARRKEKLTEKANRKYARMAEESAKREAAAKKAADAKPKLVVNRDNVIMAPALIEANKQGEGMFGQKPPTKAERKAKHSEPKPGAKQVWDEAAKQWVKRG